MFPRLAIVMCLAGCATAPATPAAPVVARVTEEVQVCGAVRAFRVGETLRFTRRSCAPLSAKSSVVHCADADVDRGEVVRLIDDRCALVRVDAQSTVRPGDQWAAAAP